MIPFTHTDYSAFLGQKVHRDDPKYNDEIWTVVWFNANSVTVEHENQRMSKMYLSMFEDWVFESGKAFGKEA